ncbi:hypothetical protein CBL_02795 [Carabus blaptoides fortunei]
MEILYYKLLEFVQCPSCKIGQGYRRQDPGVFQWVASQCYLLLNKYQDSNEFLPCTYYY